MTVPDAVNSAVPAVPVSAVIVTEAVDPRASAICEATVRFQIRSYSLNSLPRRMLESSDGVRNTSPDGRIASCASWAFFDLPV